MPRYLHVLLLAVLSLIAAIPVAEAGARQFSRWICFERVRELPELKIPIGIVPVGCEVIDCCPGCPGPEPLDWLVRVEGTPVAGVELRFEGLPANTRLDFDGRAVVNREIVRLSPGESTIKGLRSPRTGRAPLAKLVLQFDRAAVEKLSAGTELDADGISLSVSIEQRLGLVPVNEFTAVYRIRRCLPPLVACQDIVDLSGNDDGDESVILLDGRRTTGCNDDQPYRSSNTQHVGNVLTAGTCNSEVFVLSTDNASGLVSPLTTVTDQCDDTIPVSLGAMLTAPVSVWLARTGAATAATADVANANLLYNVNKVGVSFAATTSDVSGNATAVSTIGTTLCANLAAITASTWYTPGRLNVYYVSNAITGGNCVANRDVVFIGTGANPASLAHEFGHAFSLWVSEGGHTNGATGFTSANIMWPGGPGTRDHFSLGQAFRMNLDVDSRLNANGVRTGDTRNCPGTTTSATCPTLALDWARP